MAVSASKKPKKALKFEPDGRKRKTLIFKDELLCIVEIGNVPNFLLKFSNHSCC